MRVERLCISWMIALAPVVGWGQTWTARVRMGPGGFPIDTETGKITILDSVKAWPRHSSLLPAELITLWCNDRAFSPQKVFCRLRGCKVGFGFDRGFYPILGYRLERTGSLDYHAVKPNGRWDSTDRTNGQVGFRIEYWRRGDYLMIEFTDMNFMSNRNELADLEESRLLSNDGVHYVAETIVPWQRIRKEYFRRMAVLAANLNEYLHAYYSHH